MTHPGSQLSALVDGQLSPDAAERALQHVAACPECTAELASARAARRALAAAFDVPVAPELTQRLLALGATSGVARGATHPVAGGRRADPFAQGSVPLPGTGGGRIPADCLHGDLTSSWWATGRWLAGTAAVAVVAGALFTLGGLPVVVPASHPAQALTVLGRAGSPVASQSAGSRDLGPTNLLIQNAVLASRGGSTVAPSQVPIDAPQDGPDLAAPDAAARVDEWLAGHGWAPFGALPDGYRVTALRVAADDGTVEVDLAGDEGSVVVVQQHGRLVARIAQTAGVEVGSTRVHLLSHVPWHATWQAGDTVVSVVAEVPSQALTAVVASYPPAEPDDSAPARIARGWAALAGTWRS